MLPPWRRPRAAQ
uniref:Uncharacterized protein n=1 Tax=Arundo donax TaxID=35708 RepID=A0A0A9GW88_ARUDO